MATEREKEREAELESAMYTNCLLLGLDPAVLGMTGSAGGGASPRVGNFRHSNPKMGEQLLYFLLSALRGPVQSAKDFDKVWPIFDSTQSRDFRKIVQGIISELESQGALPRSNSRVSSLATCCGPRFVELLWQLSVHALREVHKRTFVADVASNPLPATLTDVSYQHAAALLPVTKARIALERRKFLENANIAVERQNMWSNLAQEMTAEFRSLCAEEAYLQQELEKLQEMRNQTSLDGELWDDRLSSSSSQNSQLVSKATRIWESLLAKKSQHEILASGPIEDLIAHREHRYRISGSSLLAAMDLSSNVAHSDVLSVHSGDTSPSMDNRDQMDSPQLQGRISGLDDRGGRIQPTVDVAEVLRRWTHALQRIHKQSLNLAKANDGQGPELLRSSSESGTSGHAESLGATLAEHRQHLASIQGLINQLKEVIPTMQNSIAELTEEVNNISSVSTEEYNLRSNSSLPSQSSGRVQENMTDEVMERFSSVQPDKFTSSPALKLPHLFSLTPNSSGKNTQTPKRPVITKSNHEVLPASKPIIKQFTNDHAASKAAGPDVFDAQLIKRAVREAALAKPSNDTELQPDKSSDDRSEHFFISMSTGTSLEEDNALNHRKQQLGSSPLGIHVPKTRNGLSSAAETQIGSVGISGSPNWTSMLAPTSVNARRFLDVEEDQVFSPPLLMEAFQDNYDDLLAPLSETDAALIEH